MRLQKFTLSSLFIVAACSQPHSDDSDAPATGETQAAVTFSGASQQTYVVPPGVTKVRASLKGGGGGGGGTDNVCGGAGGAGSLIAATLTVTPGQSLTIDIGNGGGNGGSCVSNGGAGTAGASTFAPGGRGGITGTVGCSGGGGGGGGASRVSGTGISIIAAGGGGGTGASANSIGSNGEIGDGSAGAAGATGNNGSDGTAANDGGGGGGGGGGLQGGAGGSFHLDGTAPGLAGRGGKSGAPLGASSVVVTAGGGAAGAAACLGSTAQNGAVTLTAEPAITAPAANSTTPSQIPTIAGGCEPGAAITVSDGATTVCTATCSTAGTFACSPATGFSDGPHSLTVKQVDASGTITATHAFTVGGSCGDGFITGTEQCDDGGTANGDGCSATCQVETGYSCAVALTATGVDASGATITTSGTVDPNWTWSTAADGSNPQQTFVGRYSAWTAVPTGTYSSVDNNFGSSHSNQTTHWVRHVTLPASLVGTFALTAQVSVDNLVDIKVNGSSITTHNTFTAIKTFAIPASAFVVGDNTIDLVVTDQGGPNGIWFYPGANRIMSVCSAVCGNGIISTPEACDDGALTDGDGCSSTCTVESGYVCTGSPSSCHVVTAPTVTAPANGSTTNDNTPAISGDCISGATVTVNEGATTLCTATCSGGAYTCSPTTGMSDGLHTINATQTEGGVTSPASTNDTFTIDTAAPNAPTITAPADGSSTNDNTPAITGACETGATVTINEGATTLCTATCAAGAYSCTPTTALPDGAHTITATQTDGAGNTSTSTSTNATFTVDTAAPNAPVLNAPANGSITNDNTPPASGTCEPGATVVVREGATVMCSAACTMAGTFTCSPTTASADGAHAWTATQQDAAGNGSIDSNTNNFTIDTAAPAAPTITAPADGSFTGNNQPAIGGACEAGATVTVFEGTTTLCTASCSTSGTYSCTPSAPLPDGLHTINASQTDTAGNGSGLSSNDAFTVDTAKPNAPTIVAPAYGSTTGDNTPTISGACETNATVTVSEGATTLCSATCVAGAFSCTPTTALPDGPHTIVATQTDRAGNVSAPSTDDTFTVDTVAPGAPTITAPADGSITNDTTPTISGTCEVGATVTVVEGSTTLCTAICSSNNTFTCTPTTALADGDHTVTATQRDAGGNGSATSAPDTFTIDTSLPAPPTITTPVPNSSISDATPDISGACVSGNTVHVFNGTDLLCTVLCVNSTYTCTVTTPLADGPYTVTATQTNPAGTESAAASDPFIVDTTKPTAPAITAPAPGSTTNDATPTIAGTCEAGATVTVTEGATTLCTTTCSATGTFSCDSTEALPDGEHTLTASQTDAAGNVSDPSQPDTFTVDTSAPAAPTITAPAMGSSTNDNTPDITGTCEAGSTVTVRQGTTTLCTATCSATGTFTCTSTTLPDGTQTITASQTDSGGNPSADATDMFIVDTSAPAAPTIDGPAQGSTVHDSTPDINGTCEAGSTVTVREGTTVLCSTMCTAAGTYACASAPLTQGPHTINATQTDPAGNTSPASDNDTFTVAAPVGPTITSPIDGSTSDGNVTVTGTCVAGEAVVVRDGTMQFCTATCTAEGTFTCTGMLQPGDHTLTATQTNDRGEESEPSPPVHITVVVKPSDTDGDGIADPLDNCPINSNTDQSDQDHDGIGDVCDPHTDANGDGFDDNVGVSGGGCASSNDGSMATMLLLGLVTLASRRRRAAR